MSEAVAQRSAGDVLVVDDELAVVSAFERLLRSVGFVVHKATDGRVAQQLVRQQTFDVIVSDIAMPQMDGITLLRAVRERDLDVPVILVTGSPSIETAQQAIEFGALRYLCKPVDANELVAAVKNAAMLKRLAQLKREAVQHLGDLETHVGDRAGLEVAFERALKGVWMAYQPIVRYSDRTTCAYEALLRCVDPAFPNPGALLQAAERLERLHDLGRLVRAHVADTVAASAVGDVFVNLHPHDLLDDMLYEPDTALSHVARRVVLEVTERASLDSIHDVQARIQRLRALGYRVAIDDLGAGYAGLASVAHLEPEVMKIDMGLIRNIDQDPVKQKLVRAMVSLCAEMKVAVIAEGIETLAERDTVVGLGGDLLQGYLFGKPARPFVPAVC